MTTADHQQLRRQQGSASLAAQGERNMVLHRERINTSADLGEILALAEAIRTGLALAEVGVPPRLAWASWTALAEGILTRYGADRQRGLLGEAIFYSEVGWRTVESLAPALRAEGILPTPDDPAAWRRHRDGEAARHREACEMIAEAKQVGQLPLARIAEQVPAE